MAGIDPGASSITVAVRVRPFTIREAAQLAPSEEGKLFLGDGSLAAAPAPKLHQRGLRSVIKVVDDRCLVFDPPEDNPVQKFSRSVVPMSGKKVKDQVFAFDRIFDDNAAQAEVYEGTTKNLLDSVLDGYNATVFAYGATGCGKTHTITGTAQHPGIIFMTMQELFEKIQERSQEKTTEVTLSYLEIYNETIRDLLAPGNGANRPGGLMLREDSACSVTVAGLTSHHPRDVQGVMDMIVQGNECRTVSPTEANATSSRSHAVLQINVAQKDRNADVTEPHTMATLSIIDLAGSERASATKNRGDRLLEGANINKSLLALGSCINALCDPRKRNHVPYRNSKLTRLLKFSLGGNCKTVMIVCVSPSSAHFDETQNTLRYANRAKNIQTKVTRNVFNVNRHVKDFLVKIDEQIALINELKAQQRDAEAVFFTKFRRQLDRRESTAREAAQRLRVAYDKAAPERQDKLASAQRLRAIERRIGLLAAWIAAFDAVCMSRGGAGGGADYGHDDGDGHDDVMPAPLAATRRAARGIMLELESSRHHVRQRLDRANWERAIDSALQHGIRQLAEVGGPDCGEAAGLTREAELLKTAFARDAHRDVLEQERAGDAAAVQALLTAQFEMLAAMSDTLEMSEDEAVAHAKHIIQRLLGTGFSAAERVVKSDGAAVGSGGGGGIAKPSRSGEPFPPPRKGTPRRRPSTATRIPRENLRFISQPSFGAASAAAAAAPLQPPPPSPPPPPDSISVSPIKASPRRRKVHPARKGAAVSFTPVKRRSPSKRAVRWRDDDGEEGTLADFEKTPKGLFDSPQPQLQPHPTSPQLPSPSSSSSSPSSPPPPPSVGSPSIVVAAARELSPVPAPPPEPTGGKPNRFQAGFLSKSRPAVAPLTAPSAFKMAPSLSPEPRVPSLPSLGPASSAPAPPYPTLSPPGDKHSPLRALSSGRSSNLSPPGTLSLKRSTTPRRSLSSIMDENQPPSGLVPPRNWSSPSSSSGPTPAAAAASSDSESPTIDPLKVRSALRVAKRQRERRMSCMSATAASSARRLSQAALEAGGGGGGGGGSSISGRASTGSGGGGHPPASASNGVSRRKSLERRKSPPMPCLPLEWKDRAFTAGQARRMGFGGGSREVGGSQSGAGRSGNGGGGGGGGGSGSIGGSPAVSSLNSIVSRSSPQTDARASSSSGLEKGRRTTIGGGSLKGRQDLSWQ